MITRVGLGQVRGEATDVVDPAAGHQDPHAGSVPTDFARPSCHDRCVTDAAISVRDVRKRYGDLWALDGVDLRDRRRASASPCSAPTERARPPSPRSSRATAPATPETAQVLGQDPAHGDRAWRSQLGIVLQSDRDLGDLTVAEAVRHFAGLLPRSAGPRRGHRGRRPDREAQAPATRSSPAVSVDGSTSRWASSVGHACCSSTSRPPASTPRPAGTSGTLIERLKDEGTTILLTTHYLEEAEHLADRVAVIARGRVLACDAPAGLGGRERGSARVTLAGGRGPRRDPDAWIPPGRPRPVARGSTARSPGSSVHREHARGRLPRRCSTDDATTRR